MNPAIEQLRRLGRFGFRGERLFNQDGHLTLVHYTRDLRGVREVVLVYNESAALAYRTRDVVNLDSPLRIGDNAVEWRLHGDVVTVVNALLSLPTPIDMSTRQPRGRRRVIHASCSVHQGAVGYTNLVVSQRGGEIELDPHVDGSCKLTLSEGESCALRDVLMEWLG